MFGTGLFAPIYQRLTSGRGVAPEPIPLPPADFRALVNGGPINEEDHAQLGHILLEMIKRHCGTTESSTVLDIGCGCGRVAHPMASYLTRGTYHGVDIVKPMVDWCRAEITSRHRNFRFHHADLTNTLYSNSGTSAADYVFPFPDATFDAIFATSVFTHLLPASAQQYLAEVARLLKPDGRAFMTFFLLSGPRPKRTMNGNLYKRDGYYIVNEDNPEHIVVFEEPVARQMILNAGLKVVSANLAPPSDNPEDWSPQDSFTVMRA